MNSTQNINIKKKNKTMWIIFAFLSLFIVLVFFVGKSFAISLQNGTKVATNSPLTYYLNISYDGVDKNGVKSTSTTMSEIQSGYLYVEDKIPEGLIFDGFVTTSDGSIGAVQRGSNAICPGKVVDDTKEASVSEGVWNESHTEYTYHGLHYNANTRTVSFKIKNLNAGCQLTVGIKTITPSVDDPTTTETELRRDFYSYATIREKGLTNNSNTTHAYIGAEGATLYNVSYEYTGTVPANAPALPATSSYSANDTVGVASDVVLEGYTFSGWTTTDVIVNSNSFTMPSNDVVFKGSFTENTKYKVTYQLTGTTPPSYVLPLEKNYYAGEIVNVDTLKTGDIFNGYRFLGWESSDVTINSENEFTMPNKNVVMTGAFEEVKYNVKYQFRGSNIPSNATNYLPATKSYKAGDQVTLENVLSEPTGYKFLGWSKESEFIMPANDVIVYGEWKLQTGTFEPTITNEVISRKEYYRIGDIVKFKTTITNTASFKIENIIVNIDENSQLIADENHKYTISTDHIANIDNIPAGGKVEVYSTYQVSATDNNVVQNTVTLTGALANNNYELKEKDYIATAEFKIQSKLKVCAKVEGVAVPNTFQFHITGTNGYETWITLENNQCETIYVDPSSYKISETVPQEYQITKVEGAITSNKGVVDVAQGTDYQTTFTNIFAKKGFLHSFGRIVDKIIQGGV